MSTSVSSVTKHYPSAENGFTTTTSGSVSSGATSVGLNSVSGYSNGEVVVMVIDPDDATKKQTFTGTMDTSGSQVTGVIWTAGTNQTHAAGATVVDYATATHISMISKGILVEHNQNGTHSAITATSLTATGDITSTGGVLKADAVSEQTAANGVTIDGLNIKDSALNTNASVIPNNLVASTGTSWVWQSWTPTWTGLTVGNATVSAKYVQVGKTVNFRLTVTFGTTTSIASGNTRFSFPVTASSDYMQYAIIGTGTANDSSTTYYFLYPAWFSTTECVLENMNGATAPVLNNTDTDEPFTWATGDQIAVTGTYEAAQVIK